MNRPRKDPRVVCDHDGCDVRLIFARRAGTSRVVPLEATDRPPWTAEAAGALVVISGQAWRPVELVEDFRSRQPVSDERARELVAGYPWHRPHHHEEND